MKKYRITVRRSFVAYIQARSIQQALYMANMAYGKIQAIEQLT